MFFHYYFSELKSTRKVRLATTVKVVSGDLVTVMPSLYLFIPVDFGLFYLFIYLFYFYVFILSSLCYNIVAFGCGKE